LELLKKKYKRAEVEKILGEREERFNNELSAEKEKVAELNAEVEKLSAELSYYKSAKDGIAMALESAEEKAEEIAKKAQAKYDLEMETLKSFSKRWQDYFSYIAEKYPRYEKVKNAVKLFEKLKKYINDGVEPTKAISGLDSALKKSAGAESGGKALFDPKGKISEYVVATSDGAFDLDAVLNPGELKLEDLCKELGLMEE